MGKIVHIKLPPKDEPEAKPERIYKPVKARRVKYRFVKSWAG